MASWNDSFEASFNVAIYTVGWWIVGGIIVYIGYGMSIRNNSESAIPSLIILIGLAIALFGIGAAFFKVFAEFLRKELKQEIIEFKREITDKTKSTSLTSEEIKKLMEEE